jgi:hypothetical protein
VLGTLDDVVHNQPVSEMHLLVRTQAVCGIVGIGCRTIEGEGAAIVIETDHIFFFDVVRAASVDPVSSHGCFLVVVIALSKVAISDGCGHLFSGMEWLCRERKFPLYVKGRIFYLLQDGGDDFPISVPQAVIGCRQIIF